mgnify:FL=1
MSVDIREEYFRRECFSGLRRFLEELEACPMTRDSFTSCFGIDDKMYHIVRVIGEPRV